MPVVPTYEDRGIRLDPGLNFRDSTRATGEMFGSGIGEALGSVGRGLIDVGQAVVEVKDLDATNEAKDSHNGLIGRVRELGYGEGGYLGTSGRDAVTGYAGYEAAVRQAVKDGAKGLSPLALGKYMDAATVTMNGALEDGARHAMDGRKAWTVESSARRVATFADDAMAKWGKPDAAKLDMLAALAEYQHYGTLLGWDADELASQSADLISRVHEDQILNKAKTDPIGAAADIDANKGLLLPAARERLKGTVGEAAHDEETRQGALVFANGARKPDDAPKPPAFGSSGEPAGPSRQRASLLDHAAGANAGAVLRLDNAFATNLAAFIEDAPADVRAGLSLGFQDGRDGGEGAGREADLTYDGGRLDAAPADVQDWVRRNAGKYGLTLPVGGTGGAVMAAADSVAARALRPSSEAIDRHLATIADPRRRDIARQAIVGTLDRQSRQEAERQAAAKAELWRRVDAGAAPDEVPFDIRQAAGSHAMAVARGYVARALDGPMITDDVLLRDMRLFAAGRPEDFALVDLNDYRDRLEGSDLKALAAAQSAIGQDSRKARDQGAELASAFDLAKTQLEAAGALTPGGGEDGRQLLARVQNALYDDLAAFRKANPSARPTTADFQKMINPHILGYYITPRPAAESGAGRPVRSGDISPDLRDSIARQLQQELGRQPTDGEVAREYQAFRLAQGA